MADIRALIVDDEPLARRGVRQLLTPYRDITVIGECRDGREAVRALATLAPDLVFLDVQMPGLDGLDVIRIHGADRMPLTVFVTAHDEFAVRAFEAQALDYLVKPLGAARFRDAIARVRERMRLQGAAGLAAKLTALLAGGGGPAGTARPGGTLAVPTGSGELLLDAGEVDWIEARDYQAVVHAGGRRHLVRASLTALAARLDPARFARIHRSAIVRLDAVREWRAGSGGTTCLVLRDGTAVPVSRRQAARVKSLLRPPGPRAG